MKIAIVCQNYPPATFEGGISHYSALLAENLKRRGHEVIALTSTEYTHSIKDNEQVNEIDIIRIEGPWNQITVKKIKEVVKQKEIDAVVLQYAPASFKKSFRIKWAMTRFPCQKITSFHTLWGKGFDRLFGLFMLLGCSKIIATNTEIMTILEKHIPSLLRKTFWIPIGSNISPSYDHEEGREFYDPIVCYFGMLYPGKGLNLILDVLETLKKRELQFSFKIIGGGIIYYKNFESDFKNDLKKRELDGMVEHIGHLPAKEVSKWLRRSRLVFLPYDRGMSDRRGSFMAAIRHGNAVLTSPPVVPLPFLKRDINVMWPHEPTVSGYVSLLERMLKDDELVKRLRVGAKELSNFFSWDKIASEYELVLNL